MRGFSISELYFLRHKMPKNIIRFQSLNYISEYLLKSFKCSCMPSAFKDDRLCLLVCVDTGWSNELIGYVWGYIKDTNRSAWNGIWTNYGWIGWNSNFTAMAPDQVRKWNFRVLSIYAKSDAQKIKGRMGKSWSMERRDMPPLSLAAIMCIKKNSSLDNL